MSGPRGLLDVSRFDVPARVIDDTIAALQVAGEDELEAMVAWAGRRQESTVSVTRAVVPAQTSYRTLDGLVVVVEGDALFELNRDLYDRSETLVGQVHSHGDAAYHSDTDDHLSLVTMLGSLSIVVPVFAAGGRANLEDWFWTRLVGTGRWQPFSAAELVRIV